MIALKLISQEKKSNDIVIAYLDIWLNKNIKIYLPIDLY